MKNTLFYIILLVMIITLTACPVPMTPPIVESLSEVISIKQNSQTINYNSDFDFGSIEIGRRREFPFLIEYNGSRDIGNDVQLLSKISQGAENFSFSAAPLATMKAGSRVTFFLEFHPVQLGELTGEARFSLSNDPQNQFIFKLSGLAVNAAPLIPGPPQVTPLGTAAIELNWPDAANEEGYKIYQSRTFDQPENYMIADKNQTQLEIRGLQEGEFYRFWVEAYNDVGTSPIIVVNYRNPREARWIQDQGFLPIERAYNGMVLEDMELDKMIINNNKGPGFAISYEKSTQFYQNNGDNLFELLSPTISIALEKWDILTFDIDSDGDDDVFSVPTYPISYDPYDFLHYLLSIKMFRNNNATFYAQPIDNFMFPFHYYTYLSMKAGDMNNDGVEDLVMTGFDYTTQGLMTSIFINDGIGRFSQKSQSNTLPGLDKGEIAIADLDNDGYKDVFLTGYTQVGDPDTLIFKNDGQGNLTQITSPQFETADRVILKDINQDSHADIILGKKQGAINIYRNNGNFNFSKVNQASHIANNITDMAMADLDLDGTMDLVIAGEQNNTKAVYLYRNPGNGFYTPFITHTLASDRIIYSLLIMDTDSDSDMDIIVAGRSPQNNSYGIWINENQSIY